MSYDGCDECGYSLYDCQCKDKQEESGLPSAAGLYALMEYGTTKHGYMWHRIKNDGKALCNSKLNIDFKSSSPKAMICNRCEGSAQLRKNQSKLQPMNINGDGI
jgi:hypothetical protein